MSIVISMGTRAKKDAALDGFSHFWLRYVRGFSPQYHCQRSLPGVGDPRFRKGMLLGRAYILPEPAEFNYRYIYLCGVAPQGAPGLHLALEPRDGSFASTRTYNGIEIEVIGAIELAFPDLPEGYAGMGHAYTTCKNWQFGVAYFGLEGLGGLREFHA